MEKENTGNWIERNKLTTVVIVMLIIWGSLFWFFVNYAETISQDPCSVCAKQMGDKVHCTVGDTVLSEKTFYPNGSIELEVPERKSFGEQFAEFRTPTAAEKTAEIVRKSFDVTEPLRRLQSTNSTVG